MSLRILKLIQARKRICGQVYWETVLADQDSARLIAFIGRVREEWQ